MMVRISVFTDVLLASQASGVFSRRAPNCPRKGEINRSQNSFQLIVSSSSAAGKSQPSASARTKPRESKRSGQYSVSRFFLDTKGDTSSSSAVSKIDYRHRRFLFLHRQGRVTPPG
ncbi:hypothetical protein V1515DRAFT_611829 [Lipomyces mesembrius]